MGFKGLNAFNVFSLEEFLVGKRLVFVKAFQWIEGTGKEAKTYGTKVIGQVIEDNTTYPFEGINNFGEQFTVKVRNVEPTAYQKLKPLGTEIFIADIEKASVWGEHNNEITAIAVVKVKGGEAQ